MARLNAGLREYSYRFLIDIPFRIYVVDQNAVLEWIQTLYVFQVAHKVVCGIHRWMPKIHLFGGDPEQVTIWGESAGEVPMAFHAMLY